MVAKITEVSMDKSQRKIFEEEQRRKELLTDIVASTFLFIILALLYLVLRYG